MKKKLKMTIKTLRENLDKFIASKIKGNSPFDESTEIKFCHMWGPKEVQEGQLFIRGCPSKNYIQFISSYFYYEIKSDEIKEPMLALSFNEAIEMAQNAMLQNFVVFYTRGKTTSIEAVFEDGLIMDIE
jgi:hypothetical protein